MRRHTATIRTINLVVLRLVGGVGHLQRGLLTVAIAVAAVGGAPLVVLRLWFKVIERVVGVGGVILPRRVGD